MTDVRMTSPQPPPPAQPSATVPLPEPGTEEEDFPAFSKPQPRPEKSAEQAARIGRLNRRREYLERNPAYFESVEHELADPLLYDTLIRRFQTTAEREAEGRRKGYGRVLESSLLRGEAKLSRMAEAYVGGGPPASSSSPASTSASSSRSPHQPPPEKNGGCHGSAVDDEYDNGKETNFSIESDIAAPPADREEARQRWLDFLRDRFVRGRDVEFDYGAVDEDDEYDVLARNDAEDAWFEKEEPGWAEDDDADDGGGGSGSGGGENPLRQGGRVRTGETGVQDF